MQTQRVLSTAAQKQKKIREKYGFERRVWWGAGSESKTYKPQAENKVTVMERQAREGQRERESYRRERI